jgi:hypothetical protein
MKSVISLTLITGLMMSSVPIVAQEPTVTTAGPLGRAVTREAARLSATGEPPSSGIETIQQGRKPAAESHWSRVRKLAPGTEITVTVKGSPPGQRHFVAADESDLTVLNVTHPMLSADARDVLRGLTSSHPEYFPAAEKGGQFVLEKNVRLGPDGMFIADRKVTDLTQVIEHIARTDVAQITDPGRTRAGKADLALLPLIFTLGGIAGAFIGAAVDGGPCSGVSNCASDAFPRGLFVGGLVGGVGAVALAHNALFSHKTDGVVYRAP